MHALVAVLAATQIHVVAAENFWGSLAAQLGGDRVQVTSVITNPATDPHDYEPTAADKTTIDRQIARKQIKVWVFNSQNSTPDVTRLTDAARKKGIPVTTITETLTPASATFEQWQARQLKALEAALARATK